MASPHQQEMEMKRNISYPGILLGAVAAVLAYLLVSHSAIGWMLLGMVVGALAAGASLAQRNRMAAASSSYVDVEK